MVKSHEQEYDVFAEDPWTSYHISALKLDQKLNKAINVDFNGLNNNGGGGRHGLSKTHLDFNPELYTNFMVYKSPEGWICLHDRMGFKVDFVCCIHLPLSALKNHPVIPKSLKRIQETFPNIQMDDVVRLVPKTSSKFLRSGPYNVILGSDLKTGQQHVSDWIVGLGGIENAILQQFETPLFCLMLLKYFR